MGSKEDVVLDLWNQSQTVRGYHALARLYYSSENWPEGDYYVLEARKILDEIEYVLESIGIPPEG